jgi:peroxiredoxin
MALTYTPDATLGSSCPDFKLPGVDNRDYQKSDFKNFKALLVMFICNHCPYVKAVEDRLISLGREMKLKGAEVVAISSNDAANYPDDSFANLRKRAQEKNYPFPYLYDESQNIAKTFGAVCTPDFFLYDADYKLAYRGRLDDSWKDPSLVKKEELKDAMLALINGQKPSDEQRPSMGCNIKWKK